MKNKFRNKNVLAKIKDIVKINVLIKHYILTSQRKVNELKDLYENTTNNTGWKNNKL